MSEPQLNISDILSLLGQVNKKLETNLEVISQDKPILVKPLNASHIKNIIKTTMEGLFSSNQFTLVAREVIQEVTDASLTKLNILDKAIILLYLRAKNINEKITLTLTSKDGKTMEKEVDLLDHIKNVRKELAGNVPPVHVFSTDGFTIEIGLPTIEEEFQFESNFYKTRLANIDDQNKKAVKAVFPSMFINMIAQYVKSVTAEGTKIELSNRSIGDRIAIIERMGGSATKIINNIDEKYGVIMKKAITVTEKIGTGDDEIEYNAYIEVNPELFV